MSWIRTRKGRLLDASFLNVPHKKNDGRWVLVSKAWGSGTIVIGRYDTKEEAEAEYRRFFKWLVEGGNGVFCFRDLPEEAMVYPEHDGWVDVQQVDPHLAE